MNQVTIAVHNGNFHADDIFAVAALFLFLEKSDFPAWREGKVNVIRTRDEAQYSKADFILDVGQVYDPDNNWFDHHQTGGAGTRDNGIPYASFGLVWKKFGEKICRSLAVADAVDEKLVSTVDADDTGFLLCSPTIPGVQHYIVSDFFTSYYPTWKEDMNTRDGIFLETVHIAQDLLRREIAVAQAEEESRFFVEKAYKESPEKRIVILDRYYPWKKTIEAMPEPLFVVYPSDGRWNVHAVSAEGGEKYATRKPLPAEWAGKRDSELAKITSVSDAIFCHNALFLAVALSKEGAIQLAKKAIGI